MLGVVEGNLHKPPVQPSSVATDRLLLVNGKMKWVSGRLRRRRGTRTILGTDAGDLTQGSAIVPRFSPARCHYTNLFPGNTMLLVFTMLY